MKKKKKKSKENHCPKIQKMKKEKGFNFCTEIEKFQLNELCASRRSRKALPG
jgi:hypothetical protein